MPHRELYFFRVETTKEKKYRDVPIHREACYNVLHSYDVQGRDLGKTQFSPLPVGDRIGELGQCVVG